MSRLRLLPFVAVIVSTNLGWASPARAYHVRPGDSLSSIAVRFGTTVASLESTNGLSPGATLLAGAVLKLPQTLKLQAYRVAPGDTLSAVAQEFHSTVAAIAAENGIRDVQLLPVGAVLHLPVAPPRARATVRYQVRTGDTLSGIAVRFGVGLHTLASLNHLRLADLLLAGRTLLLPASATFQQESAQVAPSDPFASAAVGYDISYPNCGLSGVSRPGFVAVGVNGGRPFTDNPCFASEYGWALGSSGPASIYINSSYSTSMLGSLTPDCSASSAAFASGSKGQLAYALGCSEAASALATPLALTADTVVWIDVELSNSWSTDRSLNTATVEGMLAYVGALRPNAAVGIYSTPAWWASITGGMQLPAVPEWSQLPPGASATCAPSFAGGPVWLNQTLATTLDTDSAC